MLIFQCQRNSPLETEPWPGRGGAGQRRYPEGTARRRMAGTLQHCTALHLLLLSVESTRLDERNTTDLSFTTLSLPHWWWW